MLRWIWLPIVFLTSLAVIAMLILRDRNQSASQRFHSSESLPIGSWYTTRSGAQSGSFRLNHLEFLPSGEYRSWISPGGGYPAGEPGYWRVDGGKLITGYKVAPNEPPNEQAFTFSRTIPNDNDTMLLGADVFIREAPQRAEGYDPRAGYSTPSIPGLN